MSRTETLVISIATFSDLDDPNSFVTNVAKVLELHGVWVIQQDYLPAMPANYGFGKIGRNYLTYYRLNTLKTTRAWKPARVKGPFAQYPATTAESRCPA